MGIDRIPRLISSRMTSSRRDPNPPTPHDHGQKVSARYCFQRGFSPRYIRDSAAVIPLSARRWARSANMLIRRLWLFIVQTTGRISRALKAAFLSSPSLSLHAPVRRATSAIRSNDRDRPQFSTSCATAPLDLTVFTVIIHTHHTQRRVVHIFLYRMLFLRFRIATRGSNCTGETMRVAPVRECFTARDIIRTPPRTFEIILFLFRFNGYILLSVITFSVRA